MNPWKNQKITPEPSMTASGIAGQAGNDEEGPGMTGYGLVPDEDAVMGAVVGAGNNLEQTLNLGIMYYCISMFTC